jgi:outer membrane protein OmpA-like peptidoglycan-associated protein
MTLLSKARLASVSLVATLCACAVAQPTPELVAARQAYDQARRGVAGDKVPAEVYEAKRALRAAERAHEHKPGSTREADLAYVAHRRALEATVLGRTQLTRERIAAAKDHREIVLLAQRDHANAQVDRLRTMLAGRERKLVVLPGDVLFESDKSELLPLAITRLDEVAESLRSEPDAKSVVVRGHADSRGSTTHNEQLSQARAEAVRQHLVSRGLAPDRVVAEGMGERLPIADNRTVEGRATNRRVEIVVEDTGPAAR